MINNNQMIRAIGIDVHKDSYSISAFDPQTTNFSAETTVAADSKSVITYLKRLKKEIAAPVTIEIGYEAGPTGFGLKRDLEKAGYTCCVSSIPFGQKDMSNLVFLIKSKFLRKIVRIPQKDRTFSPHAGYCRYKGKQAPKSLPSEIREDSCHS